MWLHWYVPQSISPGLLYLRQRNSALQRGKNFHKPNKEIVNKNLNICTCIDPHTKCVSIHTHTHTHKTDPALNVWSISECGNLFLFTDLQFFSPSGRGSPCRGEYASLQHERLFVLCSCATFPFSMEQNTTVILHTITNKSKANGAL